MTKKPRAKPPIANAPRATAAIAWPPVASTTVAREYNASVPPTGAPTVKSLELSSSVAFRQEPEQSFRSQPTRFMETPCHELGPTPRGFDELQGNLRPSTPIHSQPHPDALANLCDT